MEKKDIGEVVYNSMLGDILSEYVELLLSYYKPRLSLQYDEIFIKTKMVSLTDIGKTRAKIQKNRAKAAIMDFDGEELILCVNGHFDELKYQLLKQIRRCLGEAPEYELCEKYLTEITEEQKELVTALIKGEDKGEK